MISLISTDTHILTKQYYYYDADWIRDFFYLFQFNQNNWFKNINYDNRPLSSRRYSSRSTGHMLRIPGKNLQYEEIPATTFFFLRFTCETNRTTLDTNPLPASTNRDGSHWHCIVYLSVAGLYVIFTQGLDFKAAESIGSQLFGSVLLKLLI